MPFTFRDKQKPRDKSKDDLLSGIREKFDQDRKMFFDNTPSASGFSRVGGFFDDDPLMGSGRAGRQDIRSHLDDLAHRHPEFADSLRGPPWANEMRSGWGRDRRPSGSAGEDDTASSSGASNAASSGASNAASSAASNASAPHPEQQEQADEPGPLRGRTRNNLPQHGLRNTVPDMGQRQAQEEEAARGQRSWSAPPDSRAPPQRFVSRLDINPVNPAESAQQAPTSMNQENQSRPPPAPRQPTKPASNVRHIPIFVEGRDEPIVPKTADTEEPVTQQSAAHFTSHTQHQFQPQQSRPSPQQKRPFQTPQNNPPQQKQQNRSFNTSPRPFQSANVQQEKPQPFPNEQPAEEMPTQQDLPPPPPKIVVDPISKVQMIQNEVAGLKVEVDKYSGNSRKEKDYVFLDEMLTRNLLKLDDIETEGRDDIRQARKAAIRSIQDCINTLEAKVPLPQESQSMEVATTEGESSEMGMEVALCEGQVAEAGSSEVGSGQSEGGAGNS